MAKPTYSKKELALILAKYEMESKVLKYQLDRVKKIIKELKSGNSKKKKHKAVLEEAPKRRGRPAKVNAITTINATPKRRGRPPKPKSEVVKVKGKRGRPRKTEVVVASAPKRRGRPPKPKSEVIKVKGKRGRPRKTDKVVKKTTGKRGRPRKIDLDALVAMVQKSRN